MTSTSPQAVFVIWVPDWPVLASMRRHELAATVPVAVVQHGQVVSASAVARAQGIRRGMRRRTAQATCPTLVLLPRDEQWEAEAFTVVAQEVSSSFPECSLWRPGVLWANWKIPADRPADMDALQLSLAVKAEPIVDELALHVDVEAHVGAGGTLLAALLAAREGRAISVADTANFLAEQPVEVLQLLAVTESQQQIITEFLSTLSALGIRTLEDVKRIGMRGLVTRFGDLGRWAYRQASGQEDRAVQPWSPPLSIVEELVFDPPAQRSDYVTFATADIAQKWYRRLLEHAMSCSQVEITVTTQAGSQIQRRWQADASMWGGLTPRHITDRIRWQLDSWLNNPAVNGVEASDGGAVTKIAIAAVELQPVDLQNEGLWSLGRAKSGKVAQTVARLQAIVGMGQVLRAGICGGRTPRDRIVLTPWDQKTDIDPSDVRPWPGTLPQPSPSIVPSEVIDVNLLDGSGRIVQVDRRLCLSAIPQHIQVTASGTEPSFEYRVVNWAGPWPMIQRWWQNPVGTAAYIQVLLHDGSGILLSYRGGQWRCEGKYD